MRSQDDTDKFGSSDQERFPYVIIMIPFEAHLGLRITGDSAKLPLS